MENLSSFFELTDFERKLGMYKIYTYGSKDSAESSELPMGVYLVTSHHNGNLSQNHFSVVSFGNYAPEDRWVDSPSLVPYFEQSSQYYHLQFNPFLRKIRNKGNTWRQYNIIKLG